VDVVYGCECEVVYGYVMKYIVYGYVMNYIVYGYVMKYIVYGYVMNYFVYGCECGFKFPVGESYFYKKKSDSRLIYEGWGLSPHR
jgi:hypothetical protein